MTKRYFNTTKEQLQAIRELVNNSDIYDKFMIRFKSPTGDVLYVRKIGDTKYRRYMPICNMFDRNELIYKVLIQYIIKKGTIMTTTNFKVLKTFYEENKTKYFKKNK